MDKVTRNKYVYYVNDHVGKIKTNYRKELLQIILCSNIDENKIIEKGNGTQIKFSDINNDLLQKIYNYIYNKVENIDPVLNYGLTKNSPV